jgi:hypothetical protein
LTNHHLGLGLQKGRTSTIERCPNPWALGEGAEEGPSLLARWPSRVTMHSNRVHKPKRLEAPSREVALWPRPSNPIFVFSRLLTCTRTVGQAFSMFGVDEDVSRGQKKVLSATINGDAHVERLDASCMHPCCRVFSGSPE